MKIELTQQQFNNLVGFLNRSPLRGDEVPAFNELIIALSKNDKIEETKTDDSSN